MVKIDVDGDVFGFLEKHARPFVDTPNDVLRRLLFGHESGRNGRRPVVPVADGPPLLAPQSVEEFVRGFLTAHFGSGFEKRPRYRLMFESQDTLVYFQNFNKESDHLWYRVTEGPWKELRASPKPAWVVLTYPPGGFGFVLPAADLEDHVNRAGWSRSYLEINIDPSTSRWTELDWNIAKYRKQIFES